MSKFIAVSIFLIYTVGAQAQFTCGHDEMLKEAIGHSIESKSRLNDHLANIAAIQKNKNEALGTISFVVPVVVHVVHNYGESNISDNQVKDAIRILNEDFQKSNSDISNVNSNFKNIAADIEVEFRLAQLDPNGACTNGITRTFSYLTTEGNGEDVKDLISWDTDKYYNIWVVETLISNGGNVGGYAYFPGTAPSPSHEGVIIVHKQFGSIGTSYGSQFSNRTITHETGHYLGLPHVWGLFTSPETPAACSDDDGIGDTPNTEGTILTCDTNQSTCGSIDNVQNYMDYGGCPLMFTENQKTVMQSALNSTVGGRYYLWQSNNLIATGTNDGYVTQNCTPIADFTSNTAVVCEGESIDFEDLSHGDSVDFNWSWAWTFEGATPDTSSVQNPTANYLTPGVYQVKLDASNATGTGSITRTSYVQVMYSNSNFGSDLTEGFESSSFPVVSGVPEDEWTISSFNSNTYERTTSAYSSGSASLRLDNSDYSSTHLLISPNIDLSLGGNSPKLTYDFAYAQKTSDDDDLLRVFISTNCGQSWLVRQVKSGTSLKTAEPTTSDYVPSANEWTNAEVDLSNFSSYSDFRVKFEFTSKGGNYFYLDNINIGEPSSSVEETLNSFRISPNLISGQDKISVFKSNILNSNISVFNQIGQKINFEIISVSEGQIELMFQKNQLSAGLYHIVIQGDTSKNTESFIVQ